MPRSMARYDDDGNEINRALTPFEVMDMNEAAVLATDWLTEEEKFLGLVRLGVPYTHAANELGWSGLRLKQVMADPGFSEMIAEVEEFKDETIERIVYRMAASGKEWAVKLYMFNKMGDRWKDQRTINITGGVEVAVDITVALRDEMRERVGALIRGGGLRELQRTMSEDVIDAAATEGSD